MTLISVYRYVSTFTMTIIAIDRYQALINPLHRRLSTAVSIVIIILLIWLIASVFSIPNVVFNQVVEISGHKTLFRCKVSYPSPQIVYRQVITMFTFLTQYVLPLSITAFAYIRISISIWYKLSAESDQQRSREKSRRKMIKMLATVVIVFSICWLPLNIFHIHSDFSGDTNVYNTNLFFICHWFAMSSVSVRNI
jgi:G protein-coupled receptor 83